jgi:hypothetical protein
MVLIAFVLSIFLFSCQNPTSSEKPHGASDNVSHPPIERIVFNDGDNMIVCDSISYDLENDWLHFYQDGCGETIAEFSKYLATHNFKIK